MNLETIKAPTYEHEYCSFGVRHGVRPSMPLRLWGQFVLSRSSSSSASAPRVTGFVLVPDFSPWSSDCRSPLGVAAFLVRDLVSRNLGVAGFVWFRSGLWVRPCAPWRTLFTLWFVLFVSVRPDSV